MPAQPVGRRSTRVMRRQRWHLRIEGRGSPPMPTRGTIRKWSIADFTPVSLVVQYPTVIVVPNSSPARTLAEFIALAKASPTTLTSATAGHGTGSHLVAELFKRTAGIELTHVPYRGAAPALQD